MGVSAYVCRGMWETELWDDLPDILQSLFSFPGLFGRAFVWGGEFIRYAG